MASTARLGNQRWIHAACGYGSASASTRRGGIGSRHSSCDCDYPVEQHRQMLSLGGLHDRSSGARAFGTLRGHVSARRSGHRRVTRLSGNFSPAEPSRTSGGSGKYDYRRAEPSLEPCSYGSIHHGSHSLAGAQQKALLSFGAQTSRERKHHLLSFTLGYTLSSMPPI